MTERLLTYQGVKDQIAGGRAHLLLGNGFSIACDRRFSYNQLYDYVKSKGLDQRILDVFEHIGTNNFEGVMHLLEDADWVCRHYGMINQLDWDLTPMLEDLLVVKQTLVEALAETHPSHSNQVEDWKKKQCAAFLEQYHNIFTTNYDLLLYWVEMQELEVLQGRDGFSSDPDNADADYVIFSEHVGGNKGIFFLHGALHLYVYKGQTRKHTWNRSQKTLIQNIKDNLDEGNYPLFVAEGEAEKKLVQIQGNGYLSYCLGKLGRIEKNLVVVGLSFGDNDRHIANIIADNKKVETLYIGLYGDPQSTANRDLKRSVDYILRRRQEHTSARRERPLNIHYFDVSSANVWGDQE